MLDEPVEAE